MCRPESSFSVQQNGFVATSQLTDPTVSLLDHTACAAPVIAGKGAPSQSFKYIIQLQIEEIIRWEKIGLAKAPYALSSTAPFTVLQLAIELKNTDFRLSVEKQGGD
jgi:hypothetical protein